MHRPCFLRTATISLLAASWLASSSASAEGWAAYTSENFTLYSDGSERQTKDVLEQFELFRDSALSALGLPRKAESQRLLIVVYDRQRDFERVSPGPNVAGFFYDSIFGPRMLMHVVGSDTSVQQVLFHEYVHHLMRQRSTLNYPLWYMEGLATMLMTTRITDEEIIIGQAPPSYENVIKAAGRPTVKTVVSPDCCSDAGLYLTGWLMTHYFMLGNPTRRAQTGDYLRRYDAGEDPVKAFETSYGTSVSDMELELRKYSSRRSIGGLVSPRHQHELNVTTRALAADEALLILADVAVEQARYEAAHQYFDEADKLPGESPRRANLMSRRAIAYIHEKNVKAGDELMRPLLEQGSEDGQVLGDIAHYAYDKFVEIHSSRAQGSEKEEIDRAIEYGQRAVKADAANMEAHYYLGLSYEAAGQLQKSVDAFLAGYELNSAVPRFNIDLARVLIEGHQRSDALYLISHAYSASHSSEWRADLRAIMDDLADGEIDIARHPRLVPSWQKTESPDAK